MCKLRGLKDSLLLLLLPVFLSSTWSSSLRRGDGPGLLLVFTPTPLTPTSLLGFLFFNVDGFLGSEPEALALSPVRTGVLGP
jgi:hypothetical protein